MFAKVNNLKNMKKEKKLKYLSKKRININGTPAGHQRGNRAQEQQQDTDPEHNPTPEATAAHARHITHDNETDHGKRCPGLSITFSQPPIKTAHHKRKVESREKRNSPASTTIEHSPVGHSKIKEDAERGVRRVFDQLFPIHKLDVEWLEETWMFISRPWLG